MVVLDQPAAPTARHDTLILLVGGCGCALAYGYLSWHSSAYGQANLQNLLVSLGLSSLVTLAVWWHFWHHNRQPAIGWLLGFALLFRLLGVSAFPVLEDDFYRYLWDGYQVVSQLDPYSQAPAAFFHDETLSDRLATLLDGINYPEVATVYGPTAQWLFALNHLLAPASATGLQALLGAADFALVLLLLRLAPPVWVLLYAWSPLVLKEFAFTAHVDVFGALWLVAALLAYRHQRWWLVGVALGLAAGVKVFVLVAAPFLLGYQWRAWLSFVVAAVAIALPFGLQAAWLPVGLQAMGTDWLFNSPLYLLVAQTVGIGALAATKYVALGCFSLVWGWCYWYWLRGWWQDGQPTLQQLPLNWLYAGFLLVLPVLNPWYLVWWLPFAVLKPTLTAWVAASAVLLSYVTGINTNIETLDLYQVADWALVLQFGLVAAAVAADLRLGRNRSGPNKPRSPTVPELRG